MRHSIALAAVSAAALVASTNMLVRAQTPASPAFEVASVRPSPEQLGPAAYASVGVHISGSQVRISYLALRDYLSIAYRLPVGQVEGPDWIAQARFDIAAKLPDGSSSSQVPEMLQALLADRFLLSRRIGNRRGLSRVCSASLRRAVRSFAITSPRAIPPLWPAP